MGLPAEGDEHRPANFHIVMESRDPSRNQARSYVIEAGHDLFGDFVVTTSFGRIGSKGQIRRLAFTSQIAAIRPSPIKIIHFHFLCINGIEMEKIQDEQKPRIDQESMNEELVYAFFMDNTLA